MRKASVFLAAAVLASLTLASCSGGGAGGDPVSTVQEVFRRMEAKQFSQIAELACSARRAELSEQLDLGKAMSASLPGIDPQQLLDSMTIKLNNLDVKESSRSGDQAVVHVKGQLSLSFDPEKFKPILKEILKAQGLGDVDDAMLDQFLGPMLEQAEQGTDMDDDVELVNEGGTWLICGNLVTP